MNYKKLILPLLFLGLFSLPHGVYATSGACSHHAGVDCAAGAAFDGNAICNDGSESSVAYDAMEECLSVPSVPVCTIQFEYDQEEGLCQQALASQRAYCNQMSEFYLGIGGSAPVCPVTTPTTSSICAQADACKASLDVYTQMKQQAWSNECAARGPYWRTTDNVGGCSLVCPIGYTGSSFGSVGTCQITAQQCINNIGTYSHVTGPSTCACNDGYAFDSTLDRCAPVSSQTDTTSSKIIAAETLKQAAIKTETSHSFSTPAPKKSALERLISTPFVPPTTQATSSVLASTSTPIQKTEGVSGVQKIFNWVRSALGRLKFW